MKQIKETRQLQLDLIKPELFLQVKLGKMSGGQIRNVKRLNCMNLDKEITITATNIKQTPVCISQIVLFKVDYYPKRYKIFKWNNSIKRFRHYLKFSSSFSFLVSNFYTRNSCCYEIWRISN